MNEPNEQPVTPAEPEDELDTEGQAFKWELVDDGKGGTRRLRAGWTPDDQASGRPGAGGAGQPDKPSERNPRDGR